MNPNWLGNASSTIPSNTLITNVTVGGSNYTTSVNAVPRILLSTLSTAILNTSVPSRIYSFTTPATGWYSSSWNAYADHATGSNWTNWTIDYSVRVANTIQSNTCYQLYEPINCSGQTVAEIMTQSGGGIFYAVAGQLIEWAVNADIPTGTVTTGYNGGFGFITLQKIG